MFYQNSIFLLLSVLSVFFCSTTNAAKAIRGQRRRDQVSEYWEFLKKGRSSDDYEDCDFKDISGFYKWGDLEDGSLGTMQVLCDMDYCSCGIWLFDTPGFRTCSFNPGIGLALNVTDPFNFDLGIYCADDPLGTVDLEGEPVVIFEYRDITEVKPGVLLDNFGYLYYKTNTE